MRSPVWMRGVAIGLQTAYSGTEKLASQHRVHGKRIIRLTNGTSWESGPCLTPLPPPLHLICTRPGQHSLSHQPCRAGGREGGWIGVWGRLGPPFPNGSQRPPSGRKMSRSHRKEKQAQPTLRRYSLCGPGLWVSARPDIIRRWDPDVRLPEARALSSAVSEQAHSEQLQIHNKQCSLPPQQLTGSGGNSVTPPSTKKNCRASLTLVSWVRPV